MFTVIVSLVLNIYLYFIVVTINDASGIVFDTFVVAVTLSNTLGNLRSLKESQAKSC
jgi:hypothetical protein